MIYIKFKSRNHKGDTNIVYLSSCLNLLNIIISSWIFLPENNNITHFLVAEEYYMLRKYHISFPSFWCWTPMMFLQLGYCVQQHCSEYCCVSVFELCWLRVLGTVRGVWWVRSDQERVSWEGIFSTCNINENFQEKKKDLQLE